MNATPLISSTLASAVVFLLMKLAVMAMASFPRNSLRRKPANVDTERIRKWTWRPGISTNKHRDKAVKQGSWLFWQHTKSENCILCAKSATTCSASWQQNSFPVFRAAWISVVVPEGALCFPSLMEHSPLQRGVMVLCQVGVSSFQHSYRKTDSQFNASYSALRCQNLEACTPPMCTTVFIRDS